ncbi:MAG: BspA family leucine-rich repeat surface protein [Bacilli bacterium]|nr:BspA family leucine-rich repeat surface protein [Bacilli bacterium]
MASQNNLNAVFTDIANAIRDKKGSVNTIKPINMADEILTIETKSTIYKLLEAKGTDWSNVFYVYSSYPNIFYYMTELSESDIPPSNNVVNMQYMFYRCSKLTAIPSLDTSSCTNMSGMFNYCSKLTTIPQLNTSSCTDMSYMFDNCKVLTTIPQLNTSSCTDMQYIFSGCSALTTIPQLNTSSCTNMSGMFSGCSALTTIPQLNTSSCTDMQYIFSDCSKLTTIPQLNTSSCSSVNYMFSNCRILEKIDITKFASSNNSFAYNCYSLKTLIIRTMDTIPDLNSNAFKNCYHFYGTQNNTYNPNGLKDGRIYVPDDKVASLKTATNWSVFADIIKPLSEYVE